MAGLTVATVAVPQAMAYATLAGLPPQYGLYTAIVMTAVGALLDSSRQLINGPTNAISIALLSALSLVPEADRISAAIEMAFLVGAVQLGIALLHLGDLTRFISHSVIVGFTLGASTLLLLDQTKHLLGLEPRGNPGDHFLTRFWLSIRDGRIHAPTILLGATTVGIVLSIRQANAALFRRGFRVPIPQHLVAVILAAFITWCFRLDEAHGVKIVGPIPPFLPSFEIPDLDWNRVRLQAGNAFAIAVLGLLEAVAMAKAIAVRTGQRLDVNQQCLSEGAANLAGSLFQCFPGSGSLTRSAVNQQSGAVSQWSGVIAAMAVAITMLAFAPLARFIPRAALAGLLILAAYRMVDGAQLAFHLRVTRFDAGVVAATALAAVFVSVEFCIVIGAFLSFALYVPRAAQVQLIRVPPAPDGHRLAYELEGELFFGAESEWSSHFQAIEDSLGPNTREVVLLLNRARNPDAAIVNLIRILHERLSRKNIALKLSGVRPDLAKALRATGLDKTIVIESYLSGKV